MSAPSTTSTGSGPARGAPPQTQRADGAPDQRADDDRRRRVQRHRPASPTRRTKVKESLRHPLVMPRARDPRSRLTCTRRNGCFCRPASAPSTIASRASARARRSPTPTPRRCRAWRCWRRRMPRVKADRQRSRRADGLPDRHLAFDGSVGFGRADGRQPWHRLRARRRLRRAARLHLLRDAAVGDALEQVRQCRTAGAGGGRDGASRRGCRRRARRASSATSACRAACTRSRSAPSISTASRRQAMGTPWVPRNPRQIEGPAQVREILDMAA